MKPITSMLIQELHAYAKNHQIQKAVIGLSGGLDSAVALWIATRAFGPKNVTALILPETKITPAIDIEHAKALAKHFGATMHYHAINSHLVDFNFMTWEETAESNQELKAQIRAMLLRYYAKAHNALWISSVNKSDLSLGLGTIEGELAGDLHLLGDLYKSDIIEIAKHIGLPEELVSKEPSRNLKLGQTDLEDIGTAWPQVDDVLRKLNSKVDPEVLIEKGMDSLVVHKIARMVQSQNARPKFTHIIPVGDIKAAIKKAQAAEASSL
ncbi:MAG: NAD+ synthetase [Oceanicoccus sp.]|jgi:NAD+ synthetase